mmetsp:Transcript_21547/g.39273  ORF Transcript_21547/g.39273 Transcript_21547/m.39273 type:complete len:261 (+) Transcript_21547:26-808(+)
MSVMPSPLHPPSEVGIHCCSEGRHMSCRPGAKMNRSVPTEHTPGLKLIIHCITVVILVILDTMMLTVRIVENNGSQWRASDNFVARRFHDVRARDVSQRTVVGLQRGQRNLHCQLGSRSWENDIAVGFLRRDSWRRLDACAPSKESTLFLNTPHSAATLRWIIQQRSRLWSPLRIEEPVQLRTGSEPLHQSPLLLVLRAPSSQTVLQIARRDLQHELVLREPLVGPGRSIWQMPFGATCPQGLWHEALLCIVEEASCFRL